LCRNPEVANSFPRRIVEKGITSSSVLFWNECTSINEGHYWVEVKPAKKKEDDD